MRARRLDALRRRVEHLGRERLGEAALHLRHARAHAIARQPAPDEDDEAVQARDAVAAVGERVDLELDLLVHLHRRGHRRRVVLRVAAGDREGGQERQRDRVADREQRGAAAVRAGTRCPRHRRCRRATIPAGTWRPDRARRRPSAARPEITVISDSTTRIQMNQPTIAPTWLWTIAPTAAPNTAVRANASSTRPTASRAWPSSCSDSPRAASHGSATAAAHSDRSEGEHEPGDHRRHELRQRGRGRGAAPRGTWS